MGRKLFVKTYLASALMVVLAFFMVASTFLSQLDRYATSEILRQLDGLSQAISQQASFVTVYNTSRSRDLLESSLTQVAKQNDLVILFADLDGNGVSIIDGTGSLPYKNWSLHPDLVASVLTGATVSDTSALDGVLTSTHYWVAETFQDGNGDTSGIVVVCSDSQVFVSVLQQISDSLMTILFIVLICALIVSYLTSSRLTAPMKTMAMAARGYAAGDFSVRISEDNRCDEIDELATALNNMARDLEQLDELTQSFVGNVSHEFKTPMTTIGGFVDGMLDGTIPPEQHPKYLTIISEEVRRLSRMTMRMLDAARIQSGELVLSSAPFDFTEMLTQIILSFEQKLVQKEVEVEVDFSDRIMVYGDRDYAFRGIYNLVDNAVKFIDVGGTLTLTAYPAGGFCQFVITNTGAGIPHDELPHVFDRFYKTDRSRSLDRSGAGLGLFLVSNIVTLHGGDISVWSNDGVTGFEVNLPLSPTVREHV